jgi:prepilin peptidase CpaA
MMNAGFTDILLAGLALLLIVAAVTDLRSRIIPNWLVATIAVMAPLFWWAGGVAFYPDALERICAAYLLFLMFFGIFCMRGMGGGDVKLGAALALWFPPLVTVAFVVITSIAGALVTVAAWIHHNKIKQAEGKTLVPYGIAISFAGLTILTQRFLNQFA